MPELVAFAPRSNNRTPRLAELSLWFASSAKPLGASFSPHSALLSCGIIRRQISKGRLRSHVNRVIQMGKIDHLFIVGAGFSHYAGLPLTNDFTQKLLDVAHLKTSGPSALIVKFLQQFVQDTFDHKPGAAARFWPHLEDIFTCIDLSANTGHHLGPKYAPTDLRAMRRGLIDRIIRMLRGTYTEAKEQKTEDWTTLETFFSSVVPERCAFLCMNWDTVIEEGLGRAQNVTDFDYGCGAKFAKCTRSSTTVATPNSKKSIQVIKPHGSANWLYCDICRTIFWLRPDATLRIARQLFKESDWEVVKRHIGQRYKHADGPRVCPSCRAQGLGTRFATFSYRKALDFPMFERSWLTAERLLREAQTWIFIGYSLPAADYEFKHLMKHVQLSRHTSPDLVLITGGDAAHATQRNYQKFFGPKLRSSAASCFQHGLSKKALTHLKAIGALA